MSMDPVILGCLGRVTDGEDLQMFERVQMTHQTKVRTCYICIGKHRIFFVSKDMDKLVNKLSYLHIEKAITDTNVLSGLILVLTADRDSASWEGERIGIKSNHRTALLERIGLCWQAEYMYRNFKVIKFPVFQSKLTPENESPDFLQVQPFMGYEDKNEAGVDLQHRGYKFFLRTGFRDASGLRSGTFEHEDGWEVSYNSKKVVIPPGVRITVHVHDPVSIMELERMGQDDIRTLATEYKQALIENLDQFYVMVNSAYMKRMNRTNDIASTDGWEIFVRAKEYLIACILLRREYIPPLCDTSQDIAILLRCPAVPGITYETCEVLIDECRFIADSVAPVPSGNEVYREIIQAKLDALQFNEEAYRWLEGHLKLTPTHKRPAALKFVKSIVKILDGDGLLWDKDLIDQFGDEIPTLHAPLLVAQEMLSDASGLIAGSCDSQMEAGERRNAWFARISRYLAYCLDGGLIGDRFTLSTVVQSVGKGSYETDKMLKLVVEFLLHLRERGDWNRSFAGARLPLAQLLQDPEEFAKYTFNERVMRVLLMENYIQNEWRKRSNSSGSSYEKLLASLLTSEYVGIGLRTLICRQILEQTNVTSAGPEEKHIQVLVPALVNVMQGSNLSLTSCATAALVNLSCGKQSTKTLLMSEGCMKICIRQLKVKDDDLTLYTLYLLVNLTKTPHHRAIVIKEGGLPMLVDILTSSYQNLRKHKILTEVASVVGQLCNDAETRNFLSEDYPVVPCLLWIYDGAQPNTKLKSKLLFALRQLCVLGVNKIRVGTHVIPQVIEELAMANPKFEECATNGVLLLTMLANIHTNALMMNHEGRLNDALEQCGIQENDMEKKNHKFSPALWDKIVALKERVAEAEAKAA
eukprot:gnl/TRDRNA2_/TRDRNA2_167378_c0_seq1.p1 gnl/TRDRNA2_/TRDRNA2_167378_c0~~gnl/TRDRNA2_/TRDRNA2_167378_c0_seq1.p1  ORF type:complete len:867 (+),score=164.80 gnl/TRDRNA2_/TRDRNA2_167378_c0_seq1:94-2694(+)